MFRGEDEGQDGGGLFVAAGESGHEHRTLVVLGVGGIALAMILAAFYVGRSVGGPGEQAADERAAPAPEQRPAATARPIARAPRGVAAARGTSST